jgi:HPt (histidine-containing phosphotransfer) domain-containing protein
VLRLFLTETPARLAEMKRTLAAGDWETFARHAHSIKSSSCYVGGGTLSVLGAELEARADRRELAGLDTLLADAARAFDEIAATLNRG